MSPHNLETPMALGSTSYDVSLSSEELMARWQLHVREQWLDTIKTISAQVWDDASRTKQESHLTSERLNQLIRQRIDAELIVRLLGDWATWTGSNEHHTDTKQLQLLEAALESLDPTVAISTRDWGAPIASVRLYRWLFPCIGGGLLGMLIFGTGGGFFGALGGLLGAAGGIAGVAYLANNAVVLSRHQRNVGVRNSSSPPSLWTSDASLLAQFAMWLLRKARNIGIALAGRLVDFVLEPASPSDDVPRETIAPLVDKTFKAMATLTFVLCESKRGAEEAPSNSDPGQQLQENSVLHSLTLLLRSLDRQRDDLPGIRDSALELQQRLHDADYQLESIPDGAPFRDEHRDRFRLFGLIEPGQPVQTLEPCFRRHDEILLPGRITRQRD